MGLTYIAYQEFAKCCKRVKVNPTEEQYETILRRLQQPDPLEGACFSERLILKQILDSYHDREKTA